MNDEHNSREYLLHSVIGESLPDLETIPQVRSSLLRKRVTRRFVGVGGSLVVSSLVFLFWNHFIFLENGVPLDQPEVMATSNGNSGKEYEIGNRSDLGVEIVSTKNVSSDMIVRNSNGAALFTESFPNKIIMVESAPAKALYLGESELLELLYAVGGGVVGDEGSKRYFWKTDDGMNSSG